MTGRQAVGITAVSLTLWAVIIPAVLIIIGAIA